MEQNEELIDLSELISKGIRILLKTWKVFALLLLLCIASVFAYARFIYVPRYEAKVTFAVSREVNGERTYEYNKKATDDLATAFESIIKSDVMVEAMNQAMGTEEFPAVLSAQRIGTTNLFTVVSRGPSASAAEDVIQAFLDNYARVFKITLMDIGLEIIENPEKARVYNEPRYWPLCSRAALAAVIVYFVAIAAYILLRRTVTEEEDIKLKLRSACLGTLPYIRAVKKGTRPVITSDGSRYFEMKEAVGVVRRKVEKDAKKKERKSYLITGAAEGEGTSTFAANLALSLAQKGHHTALIDLDLRNPVQSKIVPHVSMEKGQRILITIRDIQLRAYCAEQSSMLHVYCSETGSSQVAEILGSEEMKKVFAKLHQRYEFIIIDSPPILPVEDAAILARLSDAAIFMVKEDCLGINKLVDAIEMLNQATGEILGCVINGSKIHVSRYGYGYGYGYNHGYYNYGYGYRRHYGYGYGYGRRYGYGYGYGRGGYGYGYGYGKKKKKKKTKPEAETESTLNVQQKPELEAEVQKEVSGKPVKKREQSKKTS